MNLHLPSFKKASAHLGYGQSLQPARDWLVLLLLFILTLIASVLWNVWLFSQATKGQALGTGVVVEEARTIDIAPAKALFEERATERARYIEGYRFSDPSL